jgi:hypothetical protein
VSSGVTRLADGLTISTERATRPKGTRGFRLQLSARIGIRRR